MLKAKTSLLLAASFLLAAPAVAQTAPAAAPAPAAPAAAVVALPDADPAIWVVKDPDTTIYMFGTFHALDGKSDWFNEEVKTAFDQAGDAERSLQHRSGRPPLANGRLPSVVHFSRRRRRSSLFCSVIVLLPLRPPVYTVLLSSRASLARATSLSTFVLRSVVRLGPSSFPPTT